MSVDSFQRRYIFFFQWQLFTTFVSFLLLFQAILDVVVNLQFSLIEKLWQTFWRYSPPDSVEGATVTENRWGQADDDMQCLMFISNEVCQPVGEENHQPPEHI